MCDKPIIKGHAGLVPCMCRPDLTALDEEAVIRQLEGMLYGDFIGVHKTPEGPGYTITHMPTGYALLLYQNKRRAYWLGRELANSGFPWGELNLVNCRDEIGQRARRVRDQCEERMASPHKKPDVPWSINREGQDESTES